MRQDADSREIALGDGLMRVPERLLLAHARGKVLFVCGAGVSKPAGLPLFDTLVVKVYERLDPPVHRALANVQENRSAWRACCTGLNDVQTAEVARFAEGEYDVTLGMLERRRDGPGSAESTVREAVADVLREQNEPAAIHRSIIRLADRGGAVSVATTNFDLLLERAGEEFGPRPRTHSLAAMPRPTEKAGFSGVFHLHGALEDRPGFPSELVLSDQDFGDFYLRRRIVPDFVYDAARLYSLVLVGYRAQDPPMRYLLNAVAADGIHFGDIQERYSFVGSPERDPVELAEWKSRGITPIYYDCRCNHRQLARGLERWAELSAAFEGESTAVDEEVRRIVNVTRSEASQPDQEMFEHLFRRANAKEREHLADVARKAGADLGWLDAILGVVREGGRPAVG